MPGSPLRRDFESEWPVLSTGPQAVACSQNKAISSDALMLLLCQNTLINQAVCAKVSWPLPMFLSLSHSFPETQREGRGFCGRHYLAIKRERHRKKYAFFFFFWLHQNASGFQMATWICPILPSDAACLFLAPGAGELSQQYQLCGERLLLNLVSRGPRKLWKNSAV